MSSITIPPPTTPMMAQWAKCKEMTENALLLFRLGDFYEAFYGDAELAAKELGLTLTQRQGVPMAGIPQHTLDGYIDKLVTKGYRVAIADQTEDAKEAKGIVRREVTRVVSPGTVVTSSILNDKENNFFASVQFLQGVWGLSFVDLTTGEFRVIELESDKELLNELCKIRPAEILVPMKNYEKKGELFHELKRSFNHLATPIPDWRFQQESTQGELLNHFKLHSLDGFGVREQRIGIATAGALLGYLRDDLRLPIHHIRKLTPYSNSEYMGIDRMTRRNLELTEPLRESSRGATVLDLLDRTSTPMGGRLLRQWIKHPLLSVEGIESRQDGVEALLHAPTARNELVRELQQGRDLERLMMKVSMGVASPRDLATIRYSIEPLPRVKQIISYFKTPIIEEQSGKIHDLTALEQLLSEAIVDEPPARLSDGGVIREGFDPRLDELRALRRDSQSWLEAYQEKIRAESGIKTLKVGFSRNSGYYIEVSKAQASNMPQNYLRRQTLVNAERFISPELKEFEEKILSAEERIGALETELFNSVREETAGYIAPVLESADAIAHLDVLASLAVVGHEYDYVRPEVNEGAGIEIVEGRHPVIEAINRTERFIPNDTRLNDQKNQLLVITGPNMAGKSTYIRQVALIVILAQIGSFVPARSAKVGVVDQVFTRIGASDDLSRGQSTFMVEMTETANILNNATDRSLVILDEIGRGTSTFDGISIAWAVAEYLLTANGKRAKTLFATHYWELTDLAQKIEGAVNYHVAIQEVEEGIVFLRKIVAGSTDKSYGIHVGRLAGLPEEVVERAEGILQELENGGDKGAKKQTIAAIPSKGGNEFQLLLFDPKKEAKRDKVVDEVLEQLRKVEVDEMTPVEAIAMLAKLQKKLG